MLRILLALTLLAAPALAQDADRPEAGRWALLFGVAPNFTLDAFRSGTVSAKYHYAETGALRLSVGAGGTLASRDQEAIVRELPSTSDGLTEDVETDQDVYSLSASLLHLWYGGLERSVAYFAGAGLTGGFFARDRNSADVTERDGFQGGVRPNFGPTG
jgi:hypothetical protein